MLLVSEIPCEDHKNECFINLYLRNAKMRKKLLVVLAVALLAGVVLSTASAGNGPGPCTCETSVDIDPVDGFCDICGGCIPDCDGPKGPSGPKGDG